MVSTRFLRVSDRVVRYGEDPTEHHFTVSHDPDYIQVVALTAGDQAVLIKQDHVAEGWSLQLIAGNTRGFETPQAAARAELGQEGGWCAKDWHYLGVHVPQTDRIISATPGTDGAKRCHMFLARGLTPTPQRLEPTEQLQVHLVPWEVVLDCTFSGHPVPGTGLPILDCGSRLAIILADRYINTVLQRP
ncbi:MAG: NUDIX hydrolase [Patescibacteria group bacterium]